MGCKLMDDVFKIFLWIWCLENKLKKDTNPKRHLSMLLHLGMSEKNSNLKPSNVWWLMEPKVVQFKTNSNESSSLKQLVFSNRTLMSY
jgi:hypothetical protein